MCRGTAGELRGCGGCLVVVAMKIAMNMTIIAAVVMAITRLTLPPPASYPFNRNIGKNMFGLGMMVGG